LLSNWHHKEAIPVRRIASLPYLEACQVGEWVTKILPVLGTAVEVIAGDAEAVAAGYSAMVNPSIAELQVGLTAAQREADEVAPADRAYDEAQEAVAALRPQADELIQDVMDELRFHLRKRDAPSQRRIMRTYGVSFSYLPGEPADPDDAGAGSEDPPASAE
jgi:hypothetical protein